MQFFYDGQIRRYITQIIRLMSNFSYKDGDGSLRTIPVMYGDISRQVSHIIRDNSENKLPSVPRMGVYVTGVEMDRSRLSDSSFISKIHVRERAYDSTGKEYLNEQGIKTILGNTWRNTQVFSVLKKYRARQERIQNVRLREHPIEISKFELQWIKDIKI